MRIAKRNITIIILIVAFIPLIGFLVNHFDIKSKFKLESYNNIKKIEIEGVVINKFIDEENHRIPTVVVESSKDNKEVLSLLRDNSGLFNYLLVNDSIFKKANSIEVKIKRKSMNDSIFNLDYGIR